MTMTLVYDGRIEEAVGDDDLPGLECRADHLSHELRTRAAEKEDLRFRAERDFSRVEDDVADALARRGAARLSSEHDCATLLGQVLGKTARLERLPGALAPFKGEEESALHR